MSINQCVHDNSYLLSVLGKEFCPLLFLQLKNKKGKKKNLNSAKLKMYYCNGQALDLCKTRIVLLNIYSTKTAL